MPPIRLSDSELDAVMAAARPLPVHLRDPFLHAVAHALSDRNVIGPGTVHQVCCELQRQLFDPPDLSRSNDTRSTVELASRARLPWLIGQPRNCSRNANLALHCLALAGFESYHGSSRLSRM